MTKDGFLTKVVLFLVYLSVASAVVENSESDDYVVYEEDKEAPDEFGQELNDFLSSSLEDESDTKDDEVEHQVDKGGEHVVKDLDKHDGNVLEQELDKHDEKILDHDLEKMLDGHIPSDDDTASKDTEKHELKSTDKVAEKSDKVGDDNNPKSAEDEKKGKADTKLDKHDDLGPLPEDLDSLPDELPDEDDDLLAPEHEDDDDEHEDDDEHDIDIEHHEFDEETETKHSNGTASEEKGKVENSTQQNSKTSDSSKDVPASKDVSTEKGKENKESTAANETEANKKEGKTENNSENKTVGNKTEGKESGPIVDPPATGTMAKETKNSQEEINGVPVQKSSTPTNSAAQSSTTTESTEKNSSNTKMPEQNEESKPSNAQPTDQTEKPVSPPADNVKTVEPTEKSSEDKVTPPAPQTVSTPDLAKAPIPEPMKTNEEAKPIVNQREAIKEIKKVLNNIVQEMPAKKEPPPVREYSLGRNPFGARGKYGQLGEGNGRRNQEPAKSGYNRVAIRKPEEGDPWPHEIDHDTMSAEYETIRGGVFRIVIFLVLGLVMTVFCCAFLKHLTSNKKDRSQWGYTGTSQRLGKTSQSSYMDDEEFP